MTPASPSAFLKSLALLLAATGGAMAQIIPLPPVKPHFYPLPPTEPLGIYSVTPDNNTTHMPVGSKIQIDFTNVLLPPQSAAEQWPTLQTYSFQRGGRHAQSPSSANLTTDVHYTPLAGRPFIAGETLFATVTPGHTDRLINHLPSGKVYQFTTAVSRAGGGTFSSSSLSIVPVNSSQFLQGIAVGDVDGDGDLDMAVASKPGAVVHVQLNGAKAGAPPSFSAGTDCNVFTPRGGDNEGPTGVLLGDVDGDGDLDLVVSDDDYNPGTVAVRLNGGDASGSNTGVFSNGSNATFPQTPTSIVLGDVDGDGDLDLVAVAYRISTLLVRLNGGDASGSNTGVFSNGSSLTTDGRPSAVTLGDVDGDGDLDLLASNEETNVVHVRLNGGDTTGSNTGVFSNGSDCGVGAGPSAVVLADVDGDHDLDLLTSNPGLSNNDAPKTVSVRLNGGDASGSHTGVFSNGSDPVVGPSPSSLALGDVDGDRDLDLLTTSYSQAGASVVVRLNGGDASGAHSGTFSNGSSIGTDQLTSHIALGDLDGDGDLDFLAANAFSVSVGLNQRAATPGARCRRAASAAARPPQRRAANASRRGLVSRQRSG